MPHPKLIITADDYGMSPRFNQGILELATLGIVTGISVMILRKYIRSQELLALGIPLGLHLELKTKASERDVHAQIQRFQKRFGTLPAYLDGHRHRHLIPENLRCVLRVARKWSLPVRSRLLEDRLLLKLRAVGSPDNFISWHPARIPILEDRLRNAKQFAISELVVHPGYYDKNCTYLYNKQREEELLFLRSPHFNKLIRPFRLVAYTHLIQKQR